MTEAKGVLVPSELVSPGAIIEAQERASVDLQIATAKKFPRELSRVKERLLELATSTQETAESCFYALPRDGKVIEGPSIRLAEIVAMSFGNIRTGCRVIAIDESHVTSQGACHDLESNNASSVEIKRRITNKHGKRYSQDMIVTTSNAANSIAFRNAIFKVVPKALFQVEFDKIRGVGMGTERTLNARRTALFEYFKGQGVAADQVLAVVEKRAPEDITLEDLSVLRGLANAIKEGTTTVEESFLRVVDTSMLKAGRHAVGKNGKKGKEKAPAPENGTPELRPTPEDPSLGEHETATLKALNEVGVSTADIIERCGPVLQIPEKKWHELADVASAIADGQLSKDNFLKATPVSA